MRRFGLAALGAVLLLAGVALFVLPVGEPEKPHALYLLGHWTDVPWEVGLPAAVVGGVLLPAGLWLALRRRVPER